MIQTTSEGNLRKVKNIKEINKIKGSIQEIFNYLFLQHVQYSVTFGIASNHKKYKILLLG